MMSYLTAFLYLMEHGGFCLTLYPCCRKLGRGHSTVLIQGASLEESLGRADSLKK